MEQNWIKGVIKQIWIKIDTQNFDDLKNESIRISTRKNILKLDRKEFHLEKMDQKEFHSAKMDQNEF